MEIIFRSEKGMFDLVNGDSRRPVEDNATRAAWDTLNAKAMLIISSGMEYEQLQTVVSCQTACEMWNRLKSIHEQRSVVNKLQLKQQFFNYKMTETDTIAQHLSKIDSLAQALSDIDEPVKEVDKIAKALGSLPMKYCGFITAWDSYDETKQTYDNLVARLLKEEKRLTEVEEATVAFASLNAGKTSKTATDQKGKSADKRNVECFFCKKRVTTNQNVVRDRISNSLSMKIKTRSIRLYPWSTKMSRQVVARQNGWVTAQPQNTCLIEEIGFPRFIPVEQKTTLCKLEIILKLR